MLRNNENELIQGDWYFTDNDEAIVIRWGDDVEDVVTCDLKGINKPIWRWNENREAPTLSPMFLIKGERWRMEEGVLREVP